MASLARVADNTIKFEYGVAQVFALKYVTGKNLGDSQFPPFQPRVLFTAIDDRKFFFNAEEASEFEHDLLDLQVQPADFIRVTKIKHPRGGGHSFRVERVPDESDAPAWVSRDEALLAKSLELARTQGAAAFVSRPDPRAEGQERQPSNPTPPHAAPAQQRITPQSAKLCGIMCSLIDAIHEGSAYAGRLNLGLSPEDLRALAITAYIQVAKEGGR